MSDLNLRYPTGGTEIWGPKAWHWFHEVADSIPCSICKPWAVRFIRGMHDIKNSHLNKKLYYPADIEFVAREAEKALNRCYSQSRCTSNAGTICHRKGH